MSHCQDWEIEGVALDWARDWDAEDRILEVSKYGTRYHKVNLCLGFECIREIPKSDY